MNLYFLSSSLGDTGGVYKSFIPWLQQEATEQGIRTGYVSLDSPDGFRTLFALCQDADNVINTGIWAYDARIKGFSILAEEDPYKDSAARLIASIGDHPFASFMYLRIANASNSFEYEIVDKTFQKVASDLSGRALKCKVVKAIATPAIDQNKLPRYDDRNISVFFPMGFGYRKADIKTFLDRILTFSRQEVYEAYLDYRFSLNLTAYEFFAKRLCRDTNTSLASHFDDKSEFFSLLSIISDADFRERFISRKIKLEKISRLIRNGTIVVAGAPPTEPMSLDTNVMFTGYINYPQILNLYASSKVVMHCHPTYFNGLHERPVTAQALGCLLATDKMQWSNLLKKNTFIDSSTPEGLAAVSNAALHEWPDAVDRISNLEVSMCYGTKALITEYIREYGRN
jgi:hypothetical protein